MTGARGLLTPGPWRVFLSHTSELASHPAERSYVAAAEAATIRTGHAISDMAYFAARDASPADYCEARVAEADVFVGIIGFRYGSLVHDQPARSYTELEFDAATRAHLPRLIFLVREDVDPPSGETPEHRVRQAAFRRRLLDDASLIVVQVASPVALEVALVHALAGLGSEVDPRASPPAPGAGIPPAPAAHFVGRETELSEMGRRLGRTGRLVVHGLGGVGKTQLVLRFIEQHRSDYPDGVLWLRGDRESSLVGDLASLAWRYRLPEREERQQERQVEAVLRRLHEHPGWLLVVDNVELTTVPALLRWVPPSLAGHVLVTSRTPMWSSRLEVESLPAEIAADFLLVRTGQADAAAATALAELLGALPLALEQAAAYLEATGRDLASYAELLRTRLVELLEEGQPEEYPHTVARTLRLSLERLASERSPATDLLCLCAFMAPDDIPIDCLEAGAGQVPHPLRNALADRLEFDRTLVALRRYSLIARNGDGLRVHRLVQTLVRAWISQDRRDAWLTAAAGVLRTTCPDDASIQMDEWPHFARLLPHVLALLEAVSDDSAQPHALGELLQRAGVYLTVRGDYPGARSLLERALRIEEDRDDPSPASIADCASRLGWLALRQGELVESRALLDRAVAIRERVLGTDHPETALTLNVLGDVLWTQGHLSAARQTYERALDIRERTRGHDDVETGTSLNNLANVLQDLGDLTAARVVRQRALDIAERRLGPDHYVTGIGVSNLGTLLLQEGDLAAAIALHERAVDIQRRRLGVAHPETGRSIHRLAEALELAGDPARARQLYEEALMITVRALGAEHHQVALCQARLATLLRDEGDLSAAEPLYERALASLSTRLGTHHHHTARIMYDLALLQRRKGDVVAARLLLERAGASLERSLGPDHRWTVESRAALDDCGAST